jgi:hypothetical protein
MEGLAAEMASLLENAPPAHRPRRDLDPRGPAGTADRRGRSGGPGPRVLESTHRQVVIGLTLVLLVVLAAIEFLARPGQEVAERSITFQP